MRPCSSPTRSCASRPHARPAIDGVPVVNGKAHFYLSTGMDPEELEPKPAPLPQSLVRVSARARREKSEHELRQRENLANAVRARILRESAPVRLDRTSIHREAPAANCRSVPIEASEDHTHVVNGSPAFGVGCAVDADVDNEVRALLRARDESAARLSATLYDVRATAFELQRILNQPKIRVLARKWREAPAALDL